MGAFLLFVFLSRSQIEPKIITLYHIPVTTRNSAPNPSFGAIEFRCS